MASTSNSENIEDKGQEGPIRCIFFSEFHHIAGPKITCQVSKTRMLINYRYFFIIESFYELDDIL